MSGRGVGGRGGKITVVTREGGGMRCYIVKEQGKEWLLPSFLSPGTFSIQLFFGRRMKEES